MGTPGPFEIIIIFLVILLIFGAKRIPEIARGLGRGIREFKSATSEITKELTVEDKPSHHIQPPRQSTPVSYTPPVQQAQAPPVQQAQAPPPQQAQAPPPDNTGSSGSPVQ